MSYELYVTGGYGFTETILPRLLHPSNAVNVARDYFTRGYQGHHIDLPPDADFSQSGNLTDTQKRKLLDDLQDGRLVLASRYRPGFELFTESEASPDLLRSDLPPALRHRLRQHWPTGARGAFARSDSLAPAVEPANPAPEPPVAETPSPGSGPYHVKLAYRWPDGTGVANLPFTLSTDQETVKGTLDAHGEAQIQGLNGRFATVRLSSDASDGDVSQQRRGIQAALEGLLKQERKEAEDLAREYEQLPWYRRGLVSIGAVSQGFSDSGMGLIRFVAGVSDLSSPTQAMLDGLKSAWAASEGSSDEHWFESYQANYEEARHRRWVEDLGFDPSDISREDIAEAYDLANLVMADPELRQSFTDFAADYAAIQHHTEISYFTGAVAFDLILTAILAVATGGVGAAGAAGTQIRHAGRLTHLGKTVKAFGEAVKKQRLRRVWRDADLNSQTVLEDTAPSRVDGLELKAADTVPNKQIGATFEGGLYRSVPEGRNPLEIHPIFNTEKAIHRYTGEGQGGLYLGSSQRIVNSEFTGNGASIEGLVNNHYSVKIDGLLDLTNPSVRSELGVSLDDLVRTGGTKEWRYEITNPLGRYAEDSGYNGIIAPAAQADGGVNIILFNSGLVK